MKNLIFLIVLCIAFEQGIAQQDTSAPFKRFPVVPPISLLKSDSGLITKEDLHKNQPVIIMYFFPDCHHCQHQIEDMIKRMDDLKKIQIILTTYKPMEEMAAFEKKYNLQDYPNIQVGRDTKYFIQPFYRIRNLPYLALYDKKGNLITTFEGNVTVDKLVEAFR
ncbi:MAG: redoxin domain-containing protein [Chitinophagaceae bacterium]|nr:redoxin domain-containing protein [Chitinophagaceae bacterium]